MEMMARIGEVEQRLTAAERTAANLAITSMAPTALAELTGRLMDMTIDEAVAVVQRMLAGESPLNGTSKKGNGVSAESAPGQAWERRMYRIEN